MAYDSTISFAPRVKAVIQTWDGNTIDVSKDIVAGNTIRRTNAASTTRLTLNNRGDHRDSVINARYTGRLSRMDRIVVFLKRAAGTASGGSPWLQVFSGYLTKVPALDLYPSTCQIEAQCTIKRLLHTYWDPGLDASQQLLVQDEANDTESQDSGLTETLVELLTEVGGWRKDDINIQKLPDKLMEILTENTPDHADPDVLAEEFAKAMGFNGTINGEAAGEGFSGDLGDMDAYLKALREHESGDRNIMNQGYSTASGYYQFMPDTWANYKGYSRAMDAPKEVQTARARQDAQAAYDKYDGDWEKVAADHLYPIWANDKSKWNASPAPGNPTVRQYVDSIMAKMKKYSSSSNSGGEEGDANAEDSVPGKNGSEGGGGSTSQADFRKPSGGKITSEFGKRAHVGFYGNMHYGIDISAGVNSPVYAAWDGKVIASGPGPGTMGTRIDIDHGTNTTRYFHLNRTDVKTGDTVKAGQQIGLEGTTPNVAPHLHFEVHRGKIAGDQVSSAIDPGPLIRGSSNDDHIGEGSIGEGGEGGGGGEDDVDQRIFNAIYRDTSATAVSAGLQGDRALMNDEQLIVQVQALTTAAMRSFMSAPDGSLIFFYPDHFGFFGSAPHIRIHDVEMIDVKIEAHDDPITTHVYTIGATQNPEIGINRDLDWLGTSGIAHIFQDFIFDQIIDLQPEENSFFDPVEFVQRFGARPLVAEYKQIRSPIFEFFQAVNTFMRKWAAQYATNVSFTFLPELYPGMRILLESHGIMLYVEEVTHVYDYRTGFKTQAVVSSPSSVGGTSRIEGLPIGRV